MSSSYSFNEANGDRILVIPKGVLVANEVNTIAIPNKILHTPGDLVAWPSRKGLVAHVLPEFEDDLSSDLRSDFVAKTSSCGEEEEPEAEPRSKRRDRGSSRKREGINREKEGGSSDGKKGSSSRSRETNRSEKSVPSKRGMGESARQSERGNVEPIPSHTVKLLHADSSFRRQVNNEPVESRRISLDAPGGVEMSSLQDSIKSGNLSFVYNEGDNWDDIPLGSPARSPAPSPAPSPDRSPVRSPVRSPAGSPIPSPVRQRTPLPSPIQRRRQRPFLAGNTAQDYFYYEENPPPCAPREPPYVDSDSEISGAPLRVYPHLAQETDRFQPLRTGTPIPDYAREWNEDPSANLSEIAPPQGGLEPYGETYPRSPPPSWCYEPLTHSDPFDHTNYIVADNTEEYNELYERMCC